jgi:PUA domain protein
MPEKHHRYFLREKEAKSLLAEASTKLRTDLNTILKGKTSIEVVKSESVEVFLADGKPILAKSEGNLFPTLLFAEFLAVAPKAVVDMGAVPFVCKGANVMAPGVRRYQGEFRKGDFVFVVDEKHGKALAVGEALYDVEEARKAKQGVVFRSIHFVSDGTWGLMKNTVGQTQ